MVYQYQTTNGSNKHSVEKSTIIPTLNKQQTSNMLMTRHFALEQSSLRSPSNYNTTTVSVATTEVD
jgi:hypothetical protein